VIQEKRQQFKIYSLKTFDCMKMENLKEISKDFFKFYAEYKPIRNSEFSAFSATHCARDPKDK
jgi:hypothetical protein